MKIEIKRAGPLSSIQDKGRYGYMKAGITASGVMDRKAYDDGNILVGNKGDEAVIEATLMGPEIQFDEDTFFSITGADMGAKLDGVPLERGHAYRAAKGQILTMGMAVSGVRAYIAFKGGIDVPLVMGSRSTNLKCSFGGYEGRKLLDGDQIEIADTGRLSEKEIKKLLSLVREQPEYKKNITVRAIPGPQEDRFSEEAKRKFYEEEYIVSPDSDRMGIRLRGEKISGINGTDIISDGITFGSIQITSEGNPIVLMADHQTTGGYAKIATVVTEDLNLLSQARPGDSVRFKRVEISDFQNRGGVFKWITHMRNHQR